MSPDEALARGILDRDARIAALEAQLARDPAPCCAFHASGGHPMDRHGHDAAERVYGLADHDPAGCDECSAGHRAICVAKRLATKDERTRCVGIVVDFGLSTCLDVELHGRRRMLALLRDEPGSPS